ncbi:hypothetical protein [Rhodovulum sulfidophilum]|uniref:hypothetical protein n=1 Tax=Rhodovulum sulfidophilum TaxID=35806 RepID=UPI001F346384|nr:hypothetical protein [Rhodovulum sulfidophilum]MCE8439795.1 hypothetical protein [Rhodovulum sulfidophilum]MCE8468613.1 hypothetical protein [Rhodovulum sulfidophilum]
MMVAEPGWTMSSVCFEGRGALPARHLRLVLLPSGAWPVLSAASESPRLEVKAAMDFPGNSTYELSPQPLKPFDCGCEFDQKCRA